MNARTAVSFVVLASVALVAGCAVPTGENGESVSTAESDYLKPPPPVLPGPVVCDSTAPSCTFAASGHYMTEFDSTFSCSQIYDFDGDKNTTKIVNGQFVTTTTHVYSYRVAYCQSTAAIASWVSARSGGVPVAADQGKFEGPIYATETLSQRDLPAAASGYVYVRYFVVPDVGCKGGCPTLGGT